MSNPKDGIVTGDGRSKLVALALPDDLAIARTSAGEGSDGARCSLEKVESKISICGVEGSSGRDNYGINDIVIAYAAQICKEPKYARAY